MSLYGVPARTQSTQTLLALFLRVLPNMPHMLNSCVLCSAQEPPFCAHRHHTQPLSTHITRTAEET
jgi:hypothetical protein